MNGFGEARLLRSIATSQKHRLGGDGPGGIRAGEQPIGGPLVAPVTTQQLQQLGGQKRLTVLTSFAMANSQYIAGAVDVAHLELGHFGDSEATAVQSRQARAVAKIALRLQQRL